MVHVMATSFPGFPKELFSFLTELSQNNNREWFADNKERYKQVVVAPMSDFVVAMIPRLKSVSECFVADPRSHGGSMFRIYRDTRFSKDKSPYKNNIGCHFRHMAGKNAHAPGFYLHIEANELFFGGGIWKPPGNILESIRSAIVNKPDQWETIVNNKSLVKRFGEIKGDKLKRPPRGYAGDLEHIEDIKRKSYFLIQSADPELILSPKFITEVQRNFKSISPFMEFITTAVHLPYHYPA